MSHNERCKNLVTAIEKISQNEMEEIFKMIHSYGCSYTRNNNGLFINLTWIPEELLQKLEQYVKFCNRSHTELKKYESICDVLNTKLKETNPETNKTDTSIHIPLSTQTLSSTLTQTQTQASTSTQSKLDSETKKEPVILQMNYNVDELDENEVINNDENEIDTEVETEKTVNKVSSSMKFSLLKKRYSKLSNLNTNLIETDLKQEQYILV